MRIVLQSSPFIVMAALLSASSRATAYAQEADIGLLKAAFVANQANHDAFSRYKCRYTLTKASADSEAAALRGEYKNIRSCEFIVILDGGKEKFQALAPTPISSVKGLRTEKDGRKSSSVEFIPIADLRLDKQWLRYFRPFQTATVGATGATEIQDLTPLSLSCVGERLTFTPTYFFLEGHGNNATISGRGQMLLGGQTVVHVHGKAVSIDCEWYFDPSRGYLPVKSVRRCEPPYSAVKGAYVRHLLSAKECSRARWFPMHWLQLDVEPNRAQVTLEEVRVKELDVDNKPSAEDFSIVLDAGTTIQEPAKNPAQAPRSFALRQQEKVTPDDIPRLARMLDNVGKVALMDTAIPRSSSFAWAKWPLFWAAA